MPSYPLKFSIERPTACCEFNSYSGCLSETLKRTPTPLTRPQGKLKDKKKEKNVGEMVRFSLGRNWNAVEMISCVPRVNWMDFCNYVKSLFRFMALDVMAICTNHPIYDCWLIWRTLPLVCMHVRVCVWASTCMLHAMPVGVLRGRGRGRDWRGI